MCQRLRQPLALEVPQRRRDRLVFVKARGNGDAPRHVVQHVALALDTVGPRPRHLFGHARHQFVLPQLAAQHAQVDAADLHGQLVRIVQVQQRLVLRQRERLLPRRIGGRSLARAGPLRHGAVAARVAQQIERRQEARALGRRPDLEGAVEDAAVVQVQVIFAAVRQAVFAVIGEMRHQFGQRQGRHEMRQRVRAALGLVQPLEQPQQFRGPRLRRAAPQFEAAQVVDLDQQRRDVFVDRQLGADPDRAKAEVRAGPERAGQFGVAAQVHQQVGVQAGAAAGGQFAGLRQRVVETGFPIHHAAPLTPCR